MNNYFTQFFDKVIKNPNTGCWDWIACKDKSGYGRFKNTGAHRWSKENFDSVSVKDLFVCHTCDNPGCVNPAHLFVGTHQDNINDQKIKNRTCKGVRNGQSKFSNKEIFDIRTAHKNGKRGVIKELAKQYGVNRMTISLIINNKTYLA